MCPGAAAGARGACLASRHCAHRDQDQPLGSGSLVTLNEHPLRGPARLLHNPLSALGLGFRVQSILDDLVELAEAEPPR